MQAKLRFSVILFSVLLLLLCSVLTTVGASATFLLCGCDVNCDGVVDLSDLVAVSIRYGMQVAAGTPEDTNQDGRIDLFDLICVAAHYHPTVTFPAAGTPVVKIAPWCSQFDAPGYDECNLDDEYICFEHAGGGPANMSGWRVKDERNHTYTFPPFTLLIGARVRLHTGSGTNTATDLYWGYNREVWDNAGDTVFLYDAAWRPLDQWSY